MPPTFSEEQKAFVEQISWKVGDRIADRLCEKVDQKIALHASQCRNTRRDEAAKLGDRGWGRTAVVLTLMIAVLALVVSGLTLVFR